jgi:hypothetical protein
LAVRMRSDRSATTHSPRAERAHAKAPELATRELFAVGDGGQTSLITP